MLVLTVKNSKISFTSNSKDIIPMWFPTQTLTSWKLQITIPMLIINRYLSYPLVNVYITNWNIIMSSSWVNQLFRLGHGFNFANCKRHYQRITISYRLSYYIPWFPNDFPWHTVNVITRWYLSLSGFNPPWIPSSSMLGEASIRQRFGKKTLDESIFWTPIFGRKWVTSPIFNGLV